MRRMHARLMTATFINARSRLHLSHAPNKSTSLRLSQRHAPPRRRHGDAVVGMTADHVTRGLSVEQVDRSDRVDARLDRVLEQTQTDCSRLHCKALQPWNAAAWLTSGQPRSPEHHITTQP